MRFLRDEKGSVFVLFVMLLPVFIAIIGLVIDGGIFYYEKLHLDMATEAAALSTISSYNVAIYESTGEVVLESVAARASAEKYLKDNYPEAKLVALTIEPSNTATVETSSKVEFAFMKLFGFDEREIFSSCKCIGG